MKRSSRLISRYLIQATVPYFVFSWLLLSVILFVQQASRFSDIFFSVNIPASLVWQLTLALVPNVIAFTCPMAVLVGVIIGLSKMQGDSELVAIRAAGVGNLQITLPILVLGVLLSVFAFIVNLYGVPLAARIVRQVALQTAIYKLESPIEPGVFNTEVAGYTIYVKDGDIGQGTWKNIFIHSEDRSANTVRLITSKRGRIDVTDQMSELVLEDAVVSTFPSDGDGKKFISENIGEVRFAIKTKRSELIEKLSSSQTSPEELGLSQLSEYMQSREAGAERTEAQILWQRRIILSVTPLVFCLLATALVLRFSRRGRGFGVFVALLSLIVYYFLAFLGEQLARTQRIGVLTASLLPLVVSFAVIVWFNVAGRIDIFGRVSEWGRTFGSGLVARTKKLQRRTAFIDLTTGLRDFDLILNLLRYYLLTLGFLAVVFVIFTAFELWKFAGTIDGGIWILAKYLIFLLPFIYVQLAPSAAMVATLATYVIKSRQNEIVTWTSAGQSVYRLLLPCLVFMAVLGVVNWQVQERLLPRANQVQDQLRSQLRSRGSTANKSGKYWVANDRRIYSFELGGEGAASDNAGPSPAPGNPAPPASDNAKPDPCSAGCVKDLTIYEFADTGSVLQNIYRVPFAEWSSRGIRFIGNAEKTTLGNGSVGTVTVNNGELAETNNPFLEIRSKPSHMNAAETRDQIAVSESELERRTFAVALEKKYTTLFLPFMIALFTAPFALSLSRKGKVMTIGYAVGLWLLFMGVTNLFEQLGLNGFLGPASAVWSPLIMFGALGVYLLSKVRT